MTTLSSALQSFRAMDVDGSGGVSLKEIKQGRIFGTAALRARMVETSAAEVFRSFDTDGSGVLSSAEVVKGLNSLSSSTASVLLAAQEKQSEASRFFSGQKVAAYSTLPTLSIGSPGNTVLNVLSAYFQV